MMTLNVDFISIAVDKNNRRAVISELHPHDDEGNAVTMEMIMEALTQEGVVQGIQHTVINNALNAMQNSMRIQRNIVAARATEPSVTGYWGVHQERLDTSGLQALWSRLSSQTLHAKDIHGTEVGANLIYVNEGDAFLTLSGEAFGRDVKGQEQPSSSLPPLHNTSDRISIDSTANGRVYKAQASGYVIVNAKQHMDIASLDFASDDKLTQYAVLLPVAHGLTKMIEAAESMWSDIVTHEHLSLLREGLACVLPVGKASESTPGTPGSLAFKFGDTVNQDQVSVDYKAHSPYFDIKKGDVILSITHTIQPVPGHDVTGTALPTEALPEVSFGLGANIEVVEVTAGVEEWRASIDGILLLDKKKATVLDALNIRQDVSLATGHIDSAHSVFVNGCVTAGFSVISGADVVINKSIENGATVVAEGDITIRKGVLGKDTKIQAKGNVTVIGFLQDATVVCGGDLIVEGYAFNANVYAHGSIEVQGRKNQSQDRGAVVGGTLNAFRSIKVQSVGHPMTPTRLIAGKDERAEVQLKDTQAHLKQIDKRMMSLQNASPVNLAGDDAAERIKTLDANNREKVKSILLDIKQLASEREVLAGREHKLKKRAFNPEIDKTTIHIDKFVEPDVSIAVGTARQRLEHAIQGRCLFVKEKHYLRRENS